MLSDLLNINLVEELGLDKLPVEKRDALTKQMTETLESRLSIAAMSRLSEKDRDQLGTMLDNDQDVSGFLREKIQNFDMLVAETIAEFKREMLELKDLVHKNAAA